MAPDEKRIAIALLEDNESDSILIQKALEKEDFILDWKKAACREEFLALLETSVPDLVLADFQLPSYNGLSALVDTKRLYVDIPFIIVSGVIGEDLAIKAFTLGVTDCINKNNLSRLPSAVRRALTEYGEKIRRKQAEAELAKSYQRIHTIFVHTLKAMSAALELRDPYTYGHQQRVAKLAKAIAVKLGLEQDQQEGIFLASLVHDLGKIQVPAEILMKPTKLTDLERKLIELHADAGYQILKDIDFPWPIAIAVLQHHERIDGSGYPRGIIGQEILQEAKILAVADVVEAMASHWPYRPALGIDSALNEVKRMTGVKFEEDVVVACVAVFDEGFAFE
ncbi:MAG: HD domain-containing protein [Spirochaetia bacterium]|nr:HD domain-containing protein [Spirochaetia bacterium]